MATETETEPVARRALVSAFIILHLAAITWWVFARVGLPEGRAAAAQGVLAPARTIGRTLADAVDSLGLGRNLLDRYVMASGTEQHWRMFAPNAPVRRGELILYGVTLDARGRPTLDPDPIVADERVEWLLRNNRPPCGWGMEGTPRERVLVRLFVEHELDRVDPGAQRYVGGRYVCRLTELPRPEESAAPVVQELLLFDGPRRVPAR